MHPENLAEWTHSHAFDGGSEQAERGTRWVMWITAVTMVIEIVAGWWFNSMALLADGWHMSSHAVAIGLSAMAYTTARRYAHDARFAFGTWKIEVLAGFSSAIFLVGVALLMVVGSLERMVTPHPIHYQEAIVVGVLGLVVNVVCALILGKAHHHGHGHGHSHGSAHGHGHEDHAHSDHGPDHGHASGQGLDGQQGHQQGDWVAHHDLNLKSAYLHVMADAATSVLAIAALVGGWLVGWSWLDPLMGIVGGVLVAIWAKGLIVETGKVLLDREMDHPVVDEIRQVVELGAGWKNTHITDLHVWRVGKQVYSCALTVVTTDDTLSAEKVRQALAVHEEIVHSTIEIHLVSETPISTQV